MPKRVRPFQDFAPRPTTELPPVLSEQTDNPVPSPPDPAQDGAADTRPVVKRKRRYVLVALCLLAVLSISFVVAFVWYRQEVAPLENGNVARVRIDISTGMTPTSIGKLLQQKHVIRSALAFDVYTRLHGLRAKLQAGVYSLSPAQPTSVIAEQLAGGKTDTFTVLFYPGATVSSASDSEPCAHSKATDVTHVLRCAGYTSQQVSDALGASYGGPLFAGKPAGTDLEGYVYGQTYQFSSGTTAQEVLRRTFEEFYTQIQQKQILAGLQAHGLNLYQGITLASIIQREVSSTDPSTASSDQRQVAQVFYLRLAQGMPLGSDVTAYYGAEKAGLARSVQTDTPYNTRIHTGLPPGPIAVPSIGALEAVANPAAGSYLYFLSGDDGKTYFAQTEAGHEQNIQLHCQVKCQAS